MKKIIRECIRLAERKNTPDKLSEWGNYHHFSFLIQDGKIIAWDTNKAATPPKGYPKTAKIHSEAEAWQSGVALLNKQKPFQMVNIRLDKKNNLRLSKPCVCCSHFLKKLGCDRVYFSVDNSLDFMRLRL